MSLRDRYMEHVGRPGWSVDIEVAGTDGNHIIDRDGERYVDLIAGWCTVNAGYGRDEIAEAAAEATQETAYVRPTYRNERIVELAEKLADIAPGDLSHVFRSPSGTEAVELAIKGARAYTGKETIVCNRDSYHGHAMGALSLTGPSSRKPVAPTMPGVERMPAPYEVDDWLERFERFCQDEEVAAYLTETILTHHGVRKLPEEHYREVRRICDENNVVLIFDEVANAFGRTGTMFAADQYSIDPDIMTLAKGFSSGYAPIGAAVMTQDIGQHLSDTGSTYATFGWTPDAVAAARKNIEIIEEEGLADRADELGSVLVEALPSSSIVDDVHQHGLAVGLELADGVDAGDVRDAAVEENVLVGTMHDGDYVLLSPPLNAAEEFLRDGVQRLGAALGRLE